MEGIQPIFTRKEWENLLMFLIMVAPIVPYLVSRTMIIVVGLVCILLDELKRRFRGQSSNHEQETRTNRVMDGDNRE